MKSSDTVVDGKERLLTEARRLFIERGYGEVSMQEIAAAAEMTRAAPYYHFRDKEDLFTQVFLREMEQTTALLVERVAAAGSFRDKLIAVMQLVTETGRSSFGRLVAEFDRHVSIERRAELKRAHTPPVNQLREIFHQAEANGDLRRATADTAYAVFVRLLIGQMELVRTEREIQEFVGWDAIGSPEVLVDAFLNGT
jgi:AcrR family transcriptional regulator